MCGRFSITTARFNRIEGTLVTTFPEVGPRSSSLPCTTPVRYYLRQEPGAVIPHAGICAGGAG
jgi:hypothetical protein